MRILSFSVSFLLIKGLLITCYMISFYQHFLKNKIVNFIGILQNKIIAQLVIMQNDIKILEELRLKIVILQK